LRQYRTQLGAAMRHEKAGLLLDLARRLAASAEGLTLDEMAQELGVGRRTVERMRDALWGLFPQMEELPEGLVKRFRIPKGLDGFFQSPTTEELVELSRAVETLKDSGHPQRAATLASLERKVRSALKTETLRRLTPDVEALVRAELSGVRAGPRPHEDPAMIASIRQALMAMSAVGFRYMGGSNPGRRRKVVPYGLLFDRMNYLVAAEVGRDTPMSWRLDRIVDLEVLDEPASPPVNFRLAEYAAQSFGIYHDELEDVVLRVLPIAIEDGRRWRFHPNQIVEEQPDGSLLVSFRTSGMMELAWHLITWRDTIEILAPERLKTAMIDELECALRQHRTHPASVTVASQA
jgi:predicted DNA-binding transcriptional regulator YafY